jgi:hypothetical protein
MRVVVAALLIVHGLITAAQARGCFSPGGSAPNPSWVSWWPVPMGQSWLFARLGLGGSLAGAVPGTLWLMAGACLLAAGFGLLGFVVPTTWRRVLAGVGAALSLVLFVPYAHPLYAIGIAANAAVLVVLLWARWPTPQVLGS